MIEVEKKIILDEESERKIKSISTFISSSTKDDIYFDFLNFSMMKNNMWLRSRNGKFELKISKDKNIRTKSIDIYNEIEDEAEICKILGIESIESAGLIKIMHLITKRDKYKLDVFTIDFNEITSAIDDFSYKIAEIELMVPSEKETDSAAKKIASFLNELEISYSSAVAKNESFQLNIVYVRMHYLWRF